MLHEPGVCSNCLPCRDEIRRLGRIEKAALALVAANDASLGWDRPRPGIAWRDLKASLSGGVER